ncbi:MAG: hypothetical protein Q4G45_05710 [Actinomycetia bacterium]|nr:hypothetical protein [Actinomycetes bacterium]
MRFDPTSWKQCAKIFAQAAEGLSGRAAERLDGLADVAAVGATSARPTTVDDAIALIVPESVEYVRQVIDGIVNQLLEESSALYATGQLYRDVELDNTLTAAQIEAALADTPYTT